MMMATPAFCASTAWRASASVETVVTWMKAARSFGIKDCQQLLPCRHARPLRRLVQVSHHHLGDGELGGGGRARAASKRQVEQAGNQERHNHIMATANMLRKECFRSLNAMSAIFIMAAQSRRARPVRWRKTASRFGSSISTEVMRTFDRMALSNRRGSTRLLSSTRRSAGRLRP